MKINKLLILDTNDEDRAKLEGIFKKEEDFEIVSSIKDGKEGLSLIKEQNIDLVICDLILQNSDALEVMEQAGSCDNKPKFFVVSSLKNDGFSQKCMEVGASYYMAKPFSNEVLLKRAREILNNTIVKTSSTFTSTRNRALEEKISNIFITVGIPAHIKGYQFLREAIKMAIDEPSIINSITGQLYPSIASRFSTSASKVERAIRHAIEVAWNRGKIENINDVFGLKVYDAHEKPTNGEFIALVADKMLVEGA